MKNLKFFGTSNPDVRKLQKLAKLANNIAFEDEEEDAINNELQRNAERSQGGFYPKNVIETIESGLASSALSALSKRRLESGDLNSAYSSCLKSLMLFDEYEGTWLLLAEIFVKHGDIAVSRYILDVAQRVHEQHKDVMQGEKILGISHEQSWQRQKTRVLDIIEEKEKQK